MNEVLKDFTSKFLVVYLDDSLIFSMTKEEHLKHIMVVLSRLKEEHLTINLDKCDFMKQELVYLGFFLSQGDLKMDESKVAVILSWPPPKNTSEVRTFHGLAQYYRKFIMMDTIKGGLKTKFVWTLETNKGFKTLKKEVANKPILRFPTFDELFTIECDASNIAIGGVLSQRNRIVDFFSEKLNVAKQKYSSYDLELYAIVQSLRKWRHYLLPKEFVVFTDNQNLSFFNSQDKLSHRHVKWVEELQSYTFTIKHKNGQLNKVEYALSRRLLTIQEFQIQSIGVDNFKELYQIDEDFVEAYKVCQDHLNHFHGYFTEFTLQNGLLFKGG